MGNAEIKQEVEVDYDFHPVVEIVYECISKESNLIKHSNPFYQQLELDLKDLNIICSKFSNLTGYSLGEVSELKIVIQRIKIYENTLEISKDDEESLVQIFGELFFNGQELDLVAGSYTLIYNLIDSIRSIFILSEADDIFMRLDPQSPWFYLGIDLYDRKINLYHQLKQNISKSV